MLIENTCYEHSKKLDSIHYAGGQIRYMHAVMVSRMERKLGLYHFVLLEEKFKKESFIEAHSPSFIEIQF